MVSSFFVSEKKAEKNTTGLYTMYIYIWNLIFLKIFGVNLQKDFCSRFLGGFGWLLQNHLKCLISVLSNRSSKTLQRSTFQTCPHLFERPLFHFETLFAETTHFFKKTTHQPTWSHFWLTTDVSGCPVFLRRWRKMGAFSISTLVSSWAWSLDKQIGNLRAPFQCHAHRRP